MALAIKRKLTKFTPLLPDTPTHVNVQSTCTLSAVCTFKHSPVFLTIEEGTFPACIPRKLLKFIVISDVKSTKDENWSTDATYLVFHVNCLG